MNRHILTLFFRARAPAQLAGGALLVLTICRLWMELVGSSWEATPFVRVFGPLLLATLIVTLLAHPFGYLGKTTTSMLGWLRLLATSLATGAACLGILILVGDLRLFTSMVRNLVTFVGIASVISLVIDPRKAWVVLLPLWMAIFLFESSRYPDNWPNVLWAWPLADPGSMPAFAQALMWAVFGAVAILYGSHNEPTIVE